MDRGVKTGLIHQGETLLRVLSRIYEEIQNRVPHMKIETMQDKNLEPYRTNIREKVWEAIKVK
jgi:hypothetical protein